MMIRLSSFMYFQKEILPSTRCSILSRHAHNIYSRYWLLHRSNGFSMSKQWLWWQGSWISVWLIFTRKSITTVSR